MKIEILIMDINGQLNIGQYFKLYLPIVSKRKWEVCMFIEQG